MFHLRHVRSITGPVSVPRNNDFNPPILGSALGCVIVGNGRGFAFAFGLQSIRIGQRRLEQRHNILGAFDGKCVVGREADTIAANRAIIGVSDHLYVTFFLSRGWQRCARRSV